MAGYLRIPDVAVFICRLVGQLPVFDCAAARVCYGYICCVLVFPDGINDIFYSKAVSIKYSFLLHILLLFCFLRIYVWWYASG